MTNYVLLRSDFPLDTSITYDENLIYLSDMLLLNARGYFCRRKTCKAMGTD